MADEELDQLIVEAFGRLRPVCTTLTKEHTNDNVKSLRKILEGVNPKILVELQEYVMFPLQLIIKQSTNRSDEFYTDTLNTLHWVLLRGNVQRAEMFSDLFNSLCILISEPGGRAPVKPVSEEMKLATVQCLSALTKSLDESAFSSIYTPTFLPALGHAITILLHLAEHEQMRKLRTEAMKCVMDLALKDRRVSAKLQTTLGDIFASFLPGVAMATTKVITGDVRQGHAVTMAALELWLHIVMVTLADDNLQKAQSSHDNHSDVHDEKLQSLCVTRSPEWVQSTEEKLRVLVVKIIPVKSNSSWQVRQSLVRWAEELLNHCTKSLESCIPHFLEVLVCLVADEYPSVSGDSQGALERYRDKARFGDIRPLVAILEENLHSLATGLPRLVRAAEDEQKLNTLKLLNGYLKLLGPQMRSLLYSYPHLSRLSLALVQVLELDCSHVNIIQERTAGSALSPLDVNQLHQRPRKLFKHFTDDSILLQLIQTCRLLGYYGDTHLLVDHFQDLFSQSSAYRKQCLFIINEILLGTIGQGLDVQPDSEGGHTPTDRKDLEGLVGSLLQDYLAAENFSLSVSNQSEEMLPERKAPDWQIVSTNRKLELDTIEKLNSNVLQVCLVLEGVANFATVLGVEFSYQLMYVLYPVLEKLGSESAMVSQTAHLTLLEMASATQRSSIEDLLCHNADYLVNAISTRLRHVTRYPQAPNVLRVILTYSGKDMLPLVEDTVQEVLTALDRFYDDNALLFMRVLYALAGSVRTWYPSQHCGSKPKCVQEEVFKHPSLNKPTKSTSPDDVKDFLLDYLKQRRIADGCGDDLDLDQDVKVTDEPESFLDAEDQKKEPPQHVRLVSQVLERCCHLLACDNPRLRLLVMDTTCQCCLALQDHTDVLLPLVHKLWPPFVHRLQDEEQLVIIKAFEVLSMLGQVSGDFIRTRCLKDVFPKATNCLKQLASKSQKTGPAYRFTVACRLQLSILKHVGTLSKQCDLGGNQLMPVMCSCVPYLSCRQPPVLQQACVKSFEEFIELDPDSVWLLLQNIYCPQPFVPMDTTFSEVKVHGSQRRCEFSDNVMTLLEQL